MEFKDLKKSMENIKMSDEMQKRIIRNCRSAAVRETEEITMKKRVSFNFKKSMSVAAVVAICLCITMAAGAAGHFGHFKDITDWKGAVVGTEYEQATNEIEVDVVASQGKLSVIAKLLTPAAVPYSELETFGIGKYQIVDTTGNVVADGKGADLVEIVNGEANMIISLDGVDSGNYKLLVNSFTGGKKADQPLEISGTWECDFTIRY